MSLLPRRKAVAEAPAFTRQASFSSTSTRTHSGSTRPSRINAWPVHRFGRIPQADLELQDLSVYRRADGESLQVGLRGLKIGARLCQLCVGHGHRVAAGGDLLDAQGAAVGEAFRQGKLVGGLRECRRGDLEGGLLLGQLRAVARSSIVKSGSPVLARLPIWT